MPPLSAFNASDKLDLGQRAQRQDEKGRRMNAAAEGCIKRVFCRHISKCKSMDSETQTDKLKSVIAFIPINRFQKGI